MRSVSVSDDAPTCDKCGEEMTKIHEPFAWVCRTERCAGE